MPQKVLSKLGLNTLMGTAARLIAQIETTERSVHDFGTQHAAALTPLEETQYKDLCDFFKKSRDEVHGTFLTLLAGLEE